MHTTIVIDEKYRDTAAVQLSSMLSQGGGAELVTLSEFLVRAGIEFDVETGNLNWDKSIFSKRYPDARSRRICNRVISISNATVAAMDGDEGVLTPNFVFDVYAAVLKEFREVWGEPGLYSPAGNLLPLNLQWRLFASRITDISTPKFVYGFGFANIDTKDFHRPLWKSPFDLYGWKPEEVDKNRIHPFVVDRPPGTPVFVYFVASSANVFTVEHHEVDEQIKTTLMRCANSLREMFGAFMGEALFFADGERLTFAAFSHYVKTSLSDGHFASVLESGLKQCAA